MDHKKLRNLLVKRFSKSEIRDICFEMNIEYENLDGETLNDKARELIFFCRRRDKLEELLSILKEKRPHEKWPELSEPNRRQDALDAFQTFVEKELFSESKLPRQNADLPPEKPKVLQKITDKNVNTLKQLYTFKFRSNHSIGEQSSSGVLFNSDDLIWALCDTNAFKRFDKEGNAFESLILRPSKGFYSQPDAWAIAPDGKILVTAHENTLRTWDAVTGELKLTFSTHTKNVRGLAFNQDGTILASGGDDKQIILWSLSEDGLIKTLNGHKQGVNCLVISQDGKYLASGDKHGEIMIWNLETNTSIRKFETASNFLSRFLGNVQQLAISLDNRFLACAAGSVSELSKLIVWDLNDNTKQTLPTGSDAVNRLIFNSNGSLLITLQKKVTSSSTNSLIKFWDTRDFKLVHQIFGKDIFYNSGLALNKQEDLLAYLSVDPNDFIGGYLATISLYGVW